MRALYDSKSKTIHDRGMKALLSQQARVQSWLDVGGRAGTGSG
ncbi:Uncharacterised protein [Kluyvera cryocrescens]|uniref:Uncharacterized protein n=1 Tax=Kluyvera cryocrescens TaxID=580 RepID=A0A485AV62_KLUCR|nr:Uncharacterised protein [Kluyvera cryocrescens]